MYIISGAIAGVLGGGVFGAMMGALGMLPMVAQLVGSDNPMVGLMVHLIFSAVIGGIFAAVFGKRCTRLAECAKLGTGYGVVWWVLGPLLIMPVALGMGPQLSVSGISASVPSLMGHIVFGVILGATFPLILGAFGGPGAKKEGAGS